MSETFSENELNLISKAKTTLRIMAKIVRDKDIKEAIKDKDLAQSIGNKTLEQALADPELGNTIRDRVTPDLPQLNDQEEAAVIARLGPAIFSELIKAGGGN
jgi:hypothetical protein